MRVVEMRMVGLSYPFSKSSQWWSGNNPRQLLPINNSDKPPQVFFREEALTSQQQQQAGGSRDEIEIQCLCEQGQLDRALDVLLRMHPQLDAFPHDGAYSSLLKACHRKKALLQAKQVYAHLAQHRLELTGLVAECLVLTLVKCGGLEDACQIFERLPYRTTFSWTALLSGYVDCGRGKEALKMYLRMQEEGVEPNQYTFVSVLKACSSIADLHEGKKIHADIERKGFSSDAFVANSLVSMYGKCGSLAGAENVFVRLAQHNAVSWNAMLSAYVEQDRADMALLLFRQMQEDGVSPKLLTFVIVLQACGNLEENEAMEGKSTRVGPLEIGRALHADAWREGLHLDIFVGNTLVSMYGKRNSIVEAVNVFSGLPQRDVVSWNAMLSAYVKQDRGEEALQLFRKMQGEGICPNQTTFVTALQACGIFADNNEGIVVDGQATKVVPLEIGLALHDDAQRKGFASNVFVGSTLVSMYGKCGSIARAENVLYGLSEQNLVSWNAMLSAYVEQDQGKKALQLYRKLEDKGMSPDQQTLATVLQACGTLAEQEEARVLDGNLIKEISLNLGHALHADAWKKGFDLDAFVGSTLVSMYGKCGTILEAEIVFCGLSQRDVVSWSSMLSVYVEHGKGERALQLYRQMHEEGFCSDQQSFVIALQACGVNAEMEEAVFMEGQFTKLVSLEICQALHADAQRNDLSVHIYVGNTLVTTYGKCGAIMEAERVLFGLSERNVVSWNAMISACVENGQEEKALLLFRQMQEEGVYADRWTFLVTLQACCTFRVKDNIIVGEEQFTTQVPHKIGQALHADARRKGFTPDVFVGSALVTMYGKIGSIFEAEGVFDGFSERDDFLWSLMLSAYFQQGQNDKALQLYRQMQKEHMPLDETTLMCIVQAFSKTGSMEICMELHFTIVTTQYDLNPVLANTLIHAYGSCASMGNGNAVFDGLLQPDVVSWNACIAGYAREGDFEASLKTFEEMFFAEVKPNEVTFLLLLSACSHSGLVDKGVESMESMSREYGETPDLKHYASMVDLLGRAGDFTRVEIMLRKMPMQADLAIWFRLLSACRVHCNVKLGKQAFDCAVHIQPNEAAAYVMMSNIYADGGMMAKMVAP